MAAVSASAITQNDAWKGGGTSGRKYLFKDVNIVLASQGGLTNSVGKALFGLSKIIGAQGFRTSASVALGAVPSYDGSLLVFYTAETAGTPADQTATVRGIVYGYE